MKKNKMMRLASVLLVLTLLSTSVISGTFAKYTTSDTGTDSARVAKWGFEATDASITLDDLFKSAYNNTVNSSVDVIAPGTTNSVDFSFAYDPSSNSNIATPEVDYNFTVLAEASGSYTELDSNKNFYWTLKGPNNLDNTYQTVSELLTAINELDGQYGAIGKKYEANTLPNAFYGTSNVADAKYTIGWVWVFEDADDASTAEKNEMAIQDTNDTAMGNADVLDNVTITITITATQVD